MISSLAAITLALVLLVFRVIYVMREIRSEKPVPARADPVKTLVVLGSGGHTTEMLHLMKSLQPDSYTPLVFIVADTDTTSMRRVEAFNSRQPDLIYRIPRSREVGQSYLSSILTTLWSLLYAFGIVRRIRPNVLLCNGPGTCLPIAVVTLAYRILGLCDCKIIFVESFCRVKRQTPVSCCGSVHSSLENLAEKVSKKQGCFHVCATEKGVESFVHNNINCTTRYSIDSMKEDWNPIACTIHPQWLRPSCTLYEAE